MRKKVLHIAPTPFFADRGCHIRIEGIVRCLTELGFDNSVCTYHHGHDVSNVHTVRIKPINNYTQTEAGPSKYKLWADWRLLWLTFREYRKQRPAVLHAHLHEGLLIALLVKWLHFWHRTPVVADMQGSLTGELDSHGSFQKLPFLRWPTRLLEKILMMCPNHIVCSSPHALEKIRTEFNIRADRISLAQDGADAVAELSANDQSNIKNELGIDEQSIIALYSGALLESKGLTQLQTLIENSAQITNLHFLIIGYPTENLEPFLQEQGLADRCTLTGQISFDKLPKYLGLANISIDPKQAGAGEGSGKILNYLAAGLPVVAYDTVNNREFLGAQASLATSDTALTNQLQQLCENEELRNSIGAQNRLRFDQFYSWATCQEQLSTAYKKLNLQ